MLQAVCSNRGPGALEFDQNEAMLENVLLVRRCTVGSRTGSRMSAADTRGTQEGVVHTTAQAGPGQGSEPL